MRIILEYSIKEKILHSLLLAVLSRNLLDPLFLGIIRGTIRGKSSRCVIVHIGSIFPRLDDLVIRLTSY